ncbi:MAG: FecR family protein [Thermodesulfobacteriota bacterium]
MTAFKNNKYAFVFLPVLLAFMAVILVSDVRRASAAQDSVIPENLTIEQTYRPGPGQSVGVARQARGKVVVQHEKEDHGYAVSNGMNLYNGDTLYTAHDGHLELAFNDGSNLVLAADTKLAIDKSIFDPDSKSRLSFLNMAAGKARFMVKKMSDYHHSQFNVKTESSVVGVRGSDFILEISQQGKKTVITALGNTVLEILDPAHPLEEPVLVTSFQQLVTVLGEIMGRPVDISEEEIMKLLKKLDLLSSGGGEGGGQGGEEGGYVPDGGSMEYLTGGDIDQSQFRPGPRKPFPDAIEDAGPDEAGDDPDREMRPRPPVPQLPDVPSHP